jgi:hypothetical protein
MNTRKPEAKFLIEDDELWADRTIEKAYDGYTDKRAEFCAARGALIDSIEKLHQVLDEPLRSAGLVPEGKHWSFKEDDDGDGLYIYIWAEPRLRGRRKKEIAVQQISFQASKRA